MNEPDLETGNNATGGGDRKSNNVPCRRGGNPENLQEKRCPEMGLDYKRLMDLVDAVEKRHEKLTIGLIAVEIVVLSGFVAALVCSLKLKRLKHRRVLDLRLWQWFTMGLMIASGLTVVRFITAVVLWPVNWYWRINKYVVFFTRRLKSCVDVMLWFCIILLGWYAWFRPRLRDVYGDISRVVSHQVTRFLIALCIGSFLWLIKNIIYLKLEADLHYDELFLRIQKTVAYLHGLEILNKRKRWKFLMDRESKKKVLRMAIDRSRCNNNHHEMVTEAEDEEPIVMEGFNILTEVLAMEKKSVPIWILRRLEEEYLDQMKLKSLMGETDFTKDDKRMIKEADTMFVNLAQKPIQNENPDRDLEIVRQDINKEDYGITEEDLDVIFQSNKKKEVDDDDENEVLPATRRTLNDRAIGREVDDDDENEVPATRRTLNDGDRAIGREEFLKWTVKAYKNCWGLKQTLNSSKRVFIKLNRLLCAFLLAVMLIIWLLLSEIVSTGQLALLFTPFLAASFIFGESCKKMFDGLIFAFAMHPFDVGDRVIINNTQMRVTELNILSSVFYKYDTGEEVIIPNSTLTTTTIINLDITPDQSDKVEFVIGRKTPLEDLKDLEIKIKKMLDDDIQYSSKNKVVKTGFGKDDLTMTVYFKYLVSYLTAETKAKRKSKILCEIMRFLNDMEKTKKEYPSSYKPYTVEIVFRSTIKVKLDHIEDLQTEIARGMDKKYKGNSKVVMKELTKSRIKMSLYMCLSEEDKEIHEDKLDEAASKKKDKMNNLKIIYEELKKKPVVRDVVVYFPQN